jgi:DNA-binding MarR family transcriptional regulator/GNAT superfamily N-acetyltransferase
MDHIAQIRAFNRDYTVRLGLLESSYLGSGLTLTQVRVLQEISFAGDAGVSAREIALRIGADEGYLSRILAGFAKQGWVDRQADKTDARRKLLSLTQAGKDKFAPLDAASKGLIADMTSHLDASAQDRLARALSEAHDLLDADFNRSVHIRGLQSGDIGWVTEAHGRHYAEAEGFDLRFEALVARILADFVDDRHPHKRAFIAVDERGRRIGSTFVVRENEEAARLRLVILEPEARGKGLGQRLLECALDHARACGYRKMVLWTLESSHAACALYAKAGFELISSKPSNDFGRPVVDQVWEKSLN